MGELGGVSALFFACKFGIDKWFFSQLARSVGRVLVRDGLCLLTSLYLP